VLEALEAGERARGASPKALIDDLPLFAAAAPRKPEPAASPALDRLRAIDPDSLTPRAALDALYELKALLDR
jgi:DNA mismatch repair protein MutS